MSKKSVAKFFEKIGFGSPMAKDSPRTGGSAETQPAAVREKLDDVRRRVERIERQAPATGGRH